MTGKRPAVEYSAVLLSAFGVGLESTGYIPNHLLKRRNMQPPLHLKALFDSPKLDGDFMAKFRLLKASQCFSLDDLMRFL